MMARRISRVVMLVLGAAGITLSAAAHAGKTLCCVNGQGRNVCGDILPQECYGRAYREVNEHGMTLRQVDAPPTAEQRAQRDAEVQRKKQEAIVAKEEQRRNEALLNTYASEKDIDFMRDRALDAVAASAKDGQTKLAEALKRKQKLTDELEFYKKKPVPDNLKEQIKANEIDLKALQAGVDAKKQEMQQVTAKFEEEKKRFNELKQGTRKVIPPPASASSASPAR